MAPPLRREDYTVGWVCALPVELAAAEEMFDEEFEPPSSDENDTNIYSCGRIGEHNVVMACLPEGQMGTNSAAAVAVQMKTAYKSIRFGLMVGIGGGVPTSTDIRLGDVVVSKPTGQHGGVVQYDFGKATQTGFERTGFLNTPPTILLTAIAKVRAREMRGKDRLMDYVSKLESLAKFRRQAAGVDSLFEETYSHEGGPTCAKCDKKRLLDREDRTQEIVVHYGTIGSGNQVVKNAITRDRISEDLGGILCLEMEAAGLMNTFPCLVIRGICDYADSHKNKRWQPYAAGTAAAYAKDLLSVIPLADIARTQTAHKAMKAESVYSIPFLQNVSFVGRHSELEELNQKLMVEQRCRSFSVVGLGGVGKTQLALQFAYMVKKTWTDYSILWIPTLSMEGYEQACGNMKRILNIPQTTDQQDAKEILKQYLTEDRDRKWLLIIDNADDINVILGKEDSGLRGIADYLPQSDRILTLFTTRVTEIATSLTRNNLMRLDNMSRKDAVDFFNSSLTSETIHDKPVTHKLLDELGDLPLAISQAAAFLNKNSMSVARYLELLQKSESNLVELMSKEFRDEGRYKGSKNAIATTWLLSFTQIREHDPFATELLLFIAQIEWRAIPYRLLPESQSELRTDEAIGTLCGYSFLTRRGDTSDEFDMHRLVHMATRIWMDKDGNARIVAGLAQQRIVEVFPHVNYLTREEWRRYLPHALRSLEDQESSNVLARARVCQLVSYCMAWEGRNSDAVKWHQECCRLNETLQLAPTDPEWLHSQLNLAKAYSRNRQYGEALSLSRIIAATVAGRLEEDNYELLESQQHLAIAYGTSGQIKDALELLEHVVAVRSRTLEEYDYELTSSQRNLALIHIVNEQPQQAIKILESVVEVMADSLTEEHPDLLDARQELALAYSKDRRSGEAIQLLEKIVATKTETRREEHPDQMYSQYELAQAYLNNGRIEEAIEMVKMVVAKQTKILGESHPDPLRSQDLLARAYAQNRQLKKAIQLQENVVATWARTHIEEHPWRIVSQNNLAAWYVQNGQPKKAIQLLEEVIATWPGSPIEYRFRKLEIQSQLGCAYLSIDKQVDKGIELLQNVVNTKKTMLVEGATGEAAELLKSQHDLAVVCLLYKQVKRGEELLKHVISQRESFLANDDPVLLCSQHWLGRAYLMGKQGRRGKRTRRVKQAVKQLEHVVMIRSRSLKEDDEDLLDSQLWLANAYDADKQRERAAELRNNLTALLHGNANECDDESCSSSDSDSEG